MAGVGDLLEEGELVDLVIRRVVALTGDELVKAYFWSDDANAVDSDAGDTFSSIVVIMSLRKVMFRAALKLHKAS